MALQGSQSYTLFEPGQLDSYMCANNLSDQGLTYPPLRKLVCLHGQKYMKVKTKGAGINDPNQAISVFFP